MTDNDVLLLSATANNQHEHIRLSHAVDPNSWDDYVRRHPAGSVYHVMAWQRLLQKTFGHEAFHLGAYDPGGGLVGVLPLFLVRSRIFGRILTSTPHAAYGGALAESVAVATAMCAKAREIARRMEVEFLELRNFRNAIPGDSLLQKDLYVTFRLELDPDPEKTFLKIPRKKRYRIREGIKHGLEFKVDAISPDDFFDVYSQNVRQLGTPVFPRQLFEEGRRQFGQDCRIFSVHLNGKVVAGVWALFHKDEYVSHFGASLKQYGHLSVNNFMYWMLIKYGCENGYRLFDFGRSKRGTGSCEFKEHWGMTMMPLQYQYALVRRTSMPDTSPLNPKFAMGIRAWQKLPLSVTRVLGPIISKHLI